MTPAVDLRTRARSLPPMPTVRVHRTYLQLPSLDALRPGRGAPDATWARLDACTPAEYRRLYREVGEQWHWIDRGRWSDEQLAQHLARPEISVWVLRADGADAGWVELERHSDGAIEIVYFGLKPGFIGRGLGGEMLARAVRTAFAQGATRVWLHTCSLDSPMALPNYLARGFVAFAEEDYDAQLPDAGGDA